MGLRKVRVLLIALILSADCHAGKNVIYDVSRLQARMMDDGSIGASVSSYWLFKNGIFLLPIVEFDYKDETNYRVDLMAGGPLLPNKDLGVIVRRQDFSRAGYSRSAGLQFNFHENETFREWMSSNCIKSFAQYYLSDGERDIVGDSEVYIRLQIGCSKKVHYRGVAQFLFNTAEGDQFLTINDVFFRIGKKTELYVRHQHLSDDNLAYGREGTSFGFGIRQSFRFLD